jgi:hypothetical protein
MAPEQIRLGLTMDEASKKLMEQAAEDYSGGNVSSYLRGLTALHHLLLRKGTGAADIPGWMLAQFPLPLINELADRIKLYKSPFQAISLKKRRKKQA